MTKRKLRHLWKNIRKVGYGYFLVLSIIFAVIAVFALRNNNLTALRLRDNVLKVDEQNGDVETALKDLREYVYGHMNTDLASSTSVYPPIQLKYRYDRLVNTQKQTVTTTNDKIYSDAQHYCEQLLPTGVSLNRVPCIQQYLDTHPLAKEQPIPDSLYKFDFASPVWSPDLAGWSLLLGFVFFALFLMQFILERWLRYRLKQHL